jgi:isopentenyl-diphosphate Delta-isomerase
MTAVAPDKNEFVILVDKDNNELGVMEKQEAHEKAALHRAFSVFIFNEQDELLLQQRALNKYHSAGLWTNTCCSHPRAGEVTANAAKRRLKEEMGIETFLEEKFSFIYLASFENGLTEHEFDFVFTGKFNGIPKINPTEVASYKWITLDSLIKDVAERPSVYTSWFKIILKEYLQHL